MILIKRKSVFSFFVITFIVGTYKKDPPEAVLMSNDKVGNVEIQKLRQYTSDDGDNDTLLTSPCSEHCLKPQFV